MIKFLFFAIAAYIVYRLFANDFLRKRKQAEEAEKRENESQIEAGEMVQDPECGTYVAVDGSISVRDGDQVYHFCSYDCRDKFLKRLESGGRNLPPREHEED